MLNLEPFRNKFSSPDQKQLRFYISNINSLLGQALVETLRNDHLNDEAHHSFIGSLDPYEANPLPRSVSHTIDNKDPKLLTKTILDSDVVIYDLMRCQLDEIEFVIKVLKYANYTSEKILIVVSSVMTWALCNTKEKTNPSDELLTEDDRSIRKTFPKYQFLLSVEDQCLQANAFKPNLKTYCLVSGVTYGNGEELLFGFFKQAWLLDPYELPVFSDGKNVIPMIHVRDLAEFVFQTIHRNPQNSYIFAVDHAENQDQKSVVQEISKNFGSGLIKPKPTLEAVLDENFEIIRVNLKIKPSDVFEKPCEEGLEDISFRWWCKEGFVKNMTKVCDEFIIYRGLRTNKVFISGPPVSGKTFFGKQIAKTYNIPHVHIQDVIEQFLKLDSELAEEVRGVLKEMKEKLIEEEQAKIEVEKKKNKNKKGWVEPVLDTEKLNPRIPDAYLSKIYHWRLTQNDCRYRGYVLDGFPRNYENSVCLFAKDAEKIMLEEKEREANKKPPPKDKNAKGSVMNEENLEGLKRKFELIEDVIPETVIFLHAGEEFLKERCKGMPNVAGTHYTEDGLWRRLMTYKRMNEEAPGRSVINFYRDNEFECMDVNVEEKKTPETHFEEIRAFIERKGPFKTYNSKDQLLEQEKLLEEEKERLEAIRIQEEKAREEDLFQEREKQRLQEEEEKQKLEQLRTAENSILDVRSQPLRQYLADCVIPYLTEGLIEIYKSNPENALDFLGDFLVKKSEEIDLEQVQKAMKTKEEVKKDEESP